MSPRQFGATILRQMHNKTLRKKLQVTAKTLNDEGSITFSAFSTFLFFLENIHDVGMALQFAREGNKGVDKESFKRAFRVIVRTDADSAIVDAIYDIFDTNSDGYLSRKEFYVAMKDQAIHVNQNTLGLGVTEGFTGLVLCVKEKVAEMREMEA
ncbi:hypothetical protein SARC_10896 [Sphaeroforma arctica JP610]|uniref:EF-hand domain-containing protein n=1 Tax=Sphaeroforma arctica JP610 TaxID=667725 RepID=A0A0L0FKS8_9EUKA|nr:hypothetical protein SARC_10896 [Sphaeroforma arctica JP610]KNC76613.1 hypothetical protein SARC_10896 [Sphaeroforma arctica JP610]|eukprot:XP_014150515.1 hypothetical protein SARC_10896 [Sphaeroforma arctica JP610]